METSVAQRKAKTALLMLFVATKIQTQQQQQQQPQQQQQQQQHHRQLKVMNKIILKMRE